MNKEDNCSQCWNRGFVMVTPKYWPKDADGLSYLTYPIYIQVPCEKCQDLSLKLPNELGWYDLTIRVKIWDSGMDFLFCRILDKDGDIEAEIVLNDIRGLWKGPIK